MSEKQIDEAKVLHFWNCDYDYNDVDKIIPKDTVFASFHSLYPNISEAFFHHASNELGVKTRKQRRKKFYQASVSSPTYPCRVAGGPCRAARKSETAPTFKTAVCREATVRKSAAEKGAKEQQIGPNSLL